MQRERVVYATQTQETEAQRLQRRRYEEEEYKRRLANEEYERRFAEEREAKRLAEEREARERAEKLAACKTQFACLVNETLSQQGYLPPEPSPLVMRRTHRTVARQLKRESDEKPLHQLLSSLALGADADCERADELVEEVRQNLLRSPTSVQKILRRIKGIHQSIDRAWLSVRLPDVEPGLQAQMREIEVFLSRDWSEETHRGVMAVHIDEVNQKTIIQIGVAQYGPIYVTIPEVLRPETAAMKSIEELLSRLAPFTGTVDPMAIIDGAYQGFNYNALFSKARVLRAPSGNTSRLLNNLKESERRAKLSPDNTVILNSAPRNQEEYVRIFPEDKNLRGWPAWGTEAEEWTDTVASNQFALSPQASQEALLTALTQAKNVIVVMAHCDGNRILMPEPPPEGSIVTADYLREHQAEISENAPFVYLFSCEAGNMSNVRNFATTLLECGASGVVASQTEIGGPEGRRFLDRLLNEERGAPPLKDYFDAMQDVNYRDLEVFIA